MFFWNKNNETLLTQAIIEGDIELIKRFSHSLAHRAAKNFLGFNAVDLAGFLGNEEVMKNFDLQKNKLFKVIKRGDDSVAEMDLREYEEFFQTKYCPSVRVSSYRELYKVVSKCSCVVKKSKAGAVMRELFEENRERIKNGYVCDTTIKWIDARAGYGLFTNKPIKKGEFVGEYTGLLVLRNLLAKSSRDYCMRYPRFSFGLLHYYTLDAERMGNEMRFSNHNCIPNMQPTVALENGLSHSILIALRPIESGEQLTYDYGEDYWRQRDPPVDF